MELAAPSARLAEVSVAVGAVLKCCCNSEKLDMETPGEEEASDVPVGP